MMNNFDLLDFWIRNSPQVRDELNSMQKEFDQMFMNKHTDLTSVLESNKARIETLVKAKRENLQQKFSQMEKLRAEIFEELGLNFQSN